MVARRVYCMTVCFLTSTMLILNFFIPTSAAQELSKTEEEQIEKIITTFASEPELGMKLLEDLAEENPRLAVLTIVELAKEIPEKAVIAITSLAKTNPEVTVIGLIAIARALEQLVETQPKLAATLKAVLTESIIGMIVTTPGVAAIAIQSIKQVAPDLGKSLEEEAVIAGLERDYLLAASPTMP